MTQAPNSHILAVLYYASLISSFILISEGDLLNLSPLSATLGFAALTS